MQIAITYQGYTTPGGIPWPVPITVRGGYWDEDYFSEDWCNHAGAEAEDVTSNAGMDNETTERLQVCDKCRRQYIGDEEGGAWL